MKKRIRRYFLLLIIISIVIIGSSCTTFVIKNKTFIKSDEITDNFDDYKIVFISDLHINDLLSEKYFKKVVNDIIDINPDLILFGGDYIDSDTGDIDKALELLIPLTGIESIGVMGNHDNWFSNKEIKNKLENIGIKILDNELVEISKGDQSIFIGGLADDYSDDINIYKTINTIKEEDFLILLSHSPEPYERIKEEKVVDLMLSGHTHGGQVTLLGLWAPVLPLNNKKYWRGTYSSENNKLLITNGIGVYKYPIRIFALPTIEVVILSMTM